MFPNLDQKIPRLKTYGDGVDRGGLQIGVAQDGRDRRKRDAGGLRWRRAKRVDELEAAEQPGRAGDPAPAAGAALQGPNPDQGSLEPVWTSVRAKLIGGELLAAAGVDELVVADQARHFAWRSVRPGPSARPRLGVLELRKGRDRGLQGARGGPQMRHFLYSVSQTDQARATALLRKAASRIPLIKKRQGVPTVALFAMGIAANGGTTTKSAKTQ